MLYGNQDSVTGEGQDKNLLAMLLLQASPTHIYCASLAQQRLWFLQQLQERGSAYNVHLGLWLRGSLDLAAFQASFQEIVDRHDSLRTTFRLDGQNLQQVVREYYAANIPITDLTAVADPYSEAYQLARREVEEPFDLNTGPLFRARLFRITAQDHVFLCTLHHIIT